MRIIADIGGNICNNLDTGKRLIDAAANAGADAIKFQFYRPCDIYIDKYDDKKYNIEPSIIKSLFKYANSSNLTIESFSSVFHPDGIEFLINEIGCSVFKIAAFEANRADIWNCLLEKASYIDEINFSMGLLSTEEFFKIFKRYRHENILLIPYYSISNYSGHIRKYNIGMGAARELEYLKNTHQFFNEFGFSDHTQDSYASILAVAAGATNIEKHLGLLDCPEKDFALTPEEFSTFCKEVRTASMAMSCKKNINQLVELKSQIFATLEIEAGDMITSNNVKIFRGSTLDDLATSPLNFFDLIGKESKNKYKIGEVIKEEL